MITLAVAPALVKVEMLMPVKAIVPAQIYGPPMPASIFYLAKKMQDEFNKSMFWPNLIQREIALGHEYLSLDPPKPSGNDHFVLYGRPS